MQIYMKPTLQERTDLRDRIAAARSSSGLSYAEIAISTGVDPSQVSRVCRGEFATVGGAVVRICMFLDVQLDARSDLRTRPSVDQSRAGWSQLNRAVHSAWDKTPEGAVRLAKVIAAVAQIARR